ncbi:hypothetical protein EMCRGX_G013357 [Ephydatia muelleri]
MFEPLFIRIGEPLFSDTDCPMFELSRNIEAVEGCKVLKAVSFVHDCFSEGCHFEEMGENCWKLLDVEPFHGFVVSDYIALFCVNRAHLGVPWRIGEKEKAMEIDRAHLGVPWRIGEKEKALEIDRLHEDEVLSLSWICLTRLTLLDIKTPVRLVLSFTVKRDWGEMNRLTWDDCRKKLKTDPHAKLQEIVKNGFDSLNRTLLSIADILQNQGTGVAASVGGTAPLSGAGALIVDAISQSVTLMVLLHAVLVYLVLKVQLSKMKKASMCIIVTECHPTVIPS